MGVKESVSCSQKRIRDEPRGVDGDMQHELNSSVDWVIVSPGLNKFQVLRDLRENYPCSDYELSSCNQDVATSIVRESPSKAVTSTHFPSQKKSKELTVYTRRKNRKKNFAMAEIGLDTTVSKV